MATVLPCTASSRALVIDSDAQATLCIRLKPNTDCAMPTHDYPARLDHLLDRRFINQVVAPAAIAVERPSYRPHDTAWLRQYHPLRVEEDSFLKERLSCVDPWVKHGRMPLRLLRGRLVGGDTAPN